jgi:hypothetical protein
LWLSPPGHHEHHRRHHRYARYGHDQKARAGHTSDGEEPGDQQHRDAHQHRHQAMPTMLAMPDMPSLDSWAVGRCIRARNLHGDPPLNENGTAATAVSPSESSSPMKIAALIV